MKAANVNLIRRMTAFLITVSLFSVNTVSFAYENYADVDYEIDFSGGEIKTAVIDDSGAFVSSTSRNIPSVIEEKKRQEEERLRREAEEQRQREEAEQRQREEAEFLAKYGETPSQKRERVLREIKAVEVEATAIKSADIYSSRSKTKKIGSVKKGDKLIYIDHVGEELAYIKVISSGVKGYVNYSAVSVSTKNYTVYEDFSNIDKDTFVNAKGYSSNTDYLVWVNVERQKVNVFLGSKGNWKIEKVFDCATGANKTLTPTGEYTHTLKSDGWYNPGYYVRPVLYIDTGRGLAFHSILHNPNGSIQDGTLGRPASHGCIRMADKDIQWMYQYIPTGTKVVVW